MANSLNQPRTPRKQTRQNLTPASVRKFEDQVRKKHQGVVFELTATRGLLLENTIELTRIIVPDRKQGTGTSIMRELCEFADRHDVRLRLTPASKGDYAATTSRARLIHFYKRFGFVEVQVRPVDVSPVPTMIRTYDD